MSAVKDGIVTWFIRNVVVPRTEIIDKPGFIATQFTEKSEVTYLRELILPEQIFSECERQIVEEFGDVGRQILYSAGKKFGWNYAKLSNFVQLERTSEKAFLNFLYTLMRYAEATSYGKLNHSANLSTKTFELTLYEYMICPCNGLGYVLTDGATAGFWAYMMSDASMEGVQTKCIGRGDKECLLMCAPPAIFEKKGIKFMKETDVGEAKIDASKIVLYRDINRVADAKYSGTSFKSLLEGDMFSYSRGVVRYNGEKYFFCESSVVYLLEDELCKIKGGEEVLFKIAFDYAEKIAKTQSNESYQKFISDFMGALGWGDILVSLQGNKFLVASKHFPWSERYEASKFILFRGMLSGLLSGFTNENIVLDKVECDLSEGFLNVIATETQP
jgi:predicted hydrocarbon binding protein